MEPTRIQFSTPDGLTLYADAWGDPSHRPVLLQHGGGQTRYAWGNTAAELAKAGWYAVSLDLRGHGESDWDPAGNYGIDAYAGDTTAVVAQLGRPPVVVGASLGGLAALHAQGKVEGDVFAAVVLVDVTPRINRDGAQNIINFMGAKMEDGFATLDEVADSIAEYLPHRKRPTNLEGLKKNLRLGDDGRYRWHWDPKFITSKKRLNPDTGNRLLEATSRLRVPTLLVRGRMSDIVTPETAQEFLEHVPHAEYVDVSGAGHMVAGDRNDIFCEAVVTFLDKL